MRGRAPYAEETGKRDVSIQAIFSVDWVNGG